MTAPDGVIVIGPVHIDNYNVTLTKEDYTFERDWSKPDEFHFFARTKSRLEVQAQDSETREPLSDVYVTISAGKTILTG